MNTVVVGGGAFGATAAWMLAKAGHAVDLYEKENDILRAASGINQYRLHQGYHYPRSRETMLLAIEGQKSFHREYAEAVITDPVEHFYCVAKQNSRTSATQCRDVWNACNLPYELSELSLINNAAVDATMKVREYLLDPDTLRELCRARLAQYGVNLFLNRTAREEDFDRYDLAIIATYAQNNSLLSSFPSAQKDYQFELCEKPVLKLPTSFVNKSIMVLDGPFMNLNPFGRTNTFVMGHVVHAIHHTNVGKTPNVPRPFDALINRGVINNPAVTNFHKFIAAAKEFLPTIIDAEHLGSMYTVRAVPPYRDHDDARPTTVEKINDKRIVVFSGKIVTCVDAAEQILAIVNAL